jgi:hypothetical protein
MNRVFKNIIILNLLTTFLISLNAKTTNNVDCIIIKDENSIICKYILERVNSHKKVVFNWIEPNNSISRKRVMDIPIGHGSVYDFRYIKGRSQGIWTLEVTDNNQTYKTNFLIE